MSVRTPQVKSLIDASCRSGNRDPPSAGQLTSGGSGKGTTQTLTTPFDVQRRCPSDNLAGDEEGDRLAAGQVIGEEHLMERDNGRTSHLP